MFQCKKTPSSGSVPQEPQDARYVRENYGMYIAALTSFS
jgi:hypothetical protein